MKHSRTKRIIKKQKEQPTPIAIKSPQPLKEVKEFFSVFSPFRVGAKRRAALLLLLLPLGLGQEGLLLAQLPQWPFSAGVDYGNDAGRAVALDAAGSNVYITGGLEWDFGSGPADFDPGTGTANLAAIGIVDMFLAKYSSGNPVYQWAFQIGAASQSCVGYGIAVDGSGNVYVTGTFTGTMDFDPSVGGINNLTGNGMFFAKYNSSGVHQWAFSVPSTASNTGRRIRVDGSYVYITGTFNGTADFDPSVGGINNLTSAGSDAFVAKYSTATGAYQWALNAGDDGMDIAVDGSANVYVCGNFNGIVDFNPLGAAYNLTSDGAAGGFVAKYNSSGVCQWAFTFGNTLPASCPGGNGLEYCRALAVDASANVYVSGNFWNCVDFDPNPATEKPLDSGAPGPQHLFVAKYNSAGDYQWAFSVNDNDYSSGMTTDAANVYITGKLPGTSDFDPDIGNAVLLTSAGAMDIFVAKYTLAGNYVCAFRVGHTRDQLSEDIVVDASGNMYITGSFFNATSLAPVDFDPGSGTAFLTTTGFLGSSDIFVAKYNSVCNIVLPVELISFSGKCENNNVVELQWQTATEINNDYFTIETGPKGQGTSELQWKEIGMVKGAGNSSAIRKYEFVDSQLETFNQKLETLFYRLKQTDYNGKYEYYGPISVNLTDCDANPINVFPTISSNGYFTITGGKEKADVTVYTLLGQKILAANNTMLPFTFFLGEETGAGIYLLQVKIRKESYNQKLIMQK
ncbi:MAG: T9SS type A sorting domain-containing protein [Bacteroidetes bacterium]|nr:MAG: T9SS type A sorting domain-containing protein [Bacteroidota bacterium]